MSPHDDDPSDRDAILARRAILLSTALAAFSCGSPGEGSSQPERPGTAATGTATAKPTTTATATAKAELPAALPAWDEVIAKAPPRGVPQAAEGKEREQLEWLEKRSETQYQAVRALWEGAPRCDATVPDCRPTWRTAGERLKELLDVTRGPMIGGCGGANGETATVIGRRAAHDRYIRALIERVEGHIGETAAAFGPLAEQEWRKLEANAKKPPPMPCLSPCPMPEVQSLLQSVSFPKNVSKITADEAVIKTTLDTVAQIFKGNRGKSKIVVRGHAEPTEDKPAQLAEARAKAVAELLVKAGIPKDRIMTKSFGSDLPVERPDDPALSSANRRVDFEAVPQ